MIRVSINLPTNHRLNLQLVKSRKRLDEEPLIPNMGKIFAARKGNKVSRFFRHIFENKKVKKLLGTNLALMIIGASLLPHTNGVVLAAQSDNDFAQAPIVLTTKEGVQFPIKNFLVSQGFSFFHPAVDLATEYGSPVNPILSGRVIDVMHLKTDYGNAIIIDHGNGITSLYAHLSKVEVKIGDEVKNDTEIGKVGMTGHATGPHVHLEIRDNGRPVNPLSVLPSVSNVASSPIF